MYERPEKWLGKGGRIRRRGIYWLPNLLTTIALFAGFFSIVQAMNGRFEAAAMAIFVALVFDGLDGRVARMTHTQSAFGAEYDSLSDMVAFGVAPALLATKAFACLCGLILHATSSYRLLAIAAGTENTLAG